MGKPVLSTPESEINCFAKLVDKQDCPRSSDIHYGLTMKYQVVEPLHSSSSSSSSSSHSPSNFHSFSPTSNFILVIHGAPECPRESYFKHSGTLEAFNIGDIHKLRLKRKLNRTPSPFDKLIDPYESDPCQRYISLRVESASQPILRNRSIFETLRLALRGRSLQFRFDETTQEGMEDDPELGGGGRAQGFQFQSQQRGRDDDNNNNEEEDDFDIRFFSSNRFDLAQMVQSILGRQISPPRSRLFGRDFAIGPLSLNEDLEDNNEEDEEELEDEEQLREPLVGLDPMDDEDLSLFEGDDEDDEEEDDEYDEEQDQDDEEDDDIGAHDLVMREDHPPRQLFSSLVHRQISLDEDDDDDDEDEEDDEYDEEGDAVTLGSRRAGDGDDDQNRRRGGDGSGSQPAAQRSYPYFHSTYF